VIVSIGTLVGQPHDPLLVDVEKDASKAIQDARENASFNPKQVRHRRGNLLVSLQVYLFGGSQKVSAEYCHQWKTTK